MNNKTTKLGILVLLLALGVPAAAQMVVKAEMVMLQPQIGRDDRGFNVCGVRAVVMDSLGSQVEAYDFSMTVRSRIFAGLLKAGKTRISRADMVARTQNRKVVTPSPVKFWIATESDEKTVAPQKILQSEDAGFILETADLMLTYQTIMNIAHGQRMQFAVRYKDQKYDRVISFAERMPDEELSALLTCMKSIANRMSDEAETD